MEIASLNEVPALLDLSTVEEARRAAVWSGTAPDLFPGLTVNHPLDRPPGGNIRCMPMGGGSLWAIRSSPALVAYAPQPQTEAFFTLVMQIEGSIGLSQGGRVCEMGARDMVLLDERFPFQIRCNSFTEIAVLRIPRQIALGRSPHLERVTATLLHGVQAGASLVGDTLTSAIHTVAFLGESQRSAVMTAIAHMLGVFDSTSPDTVHGWRVQAALDFIEYNYTIPGLSAHDVARSQRISRRRLDQLLLEAIGISITGQIWSRRLEQAAIDLRDPASAKRTASEIGCANGFGDPAHFTRAFKRRYGYSPLQWRALVSTAAH